MAKGNSVTVDPNVGWKVDDRGYIHGGFDTPIFGQVKQKHNSRVTANKHKRRREEEHTAKLATTLIKVMEMPEMEHVIKKES